MRTRNLRVFICGYLLFAIYLDIAFAFAVSGFLLPLGTSDPNFGEVMAAMAGLGLVGIFYLNRQRKREQVIPHDQ
jgi:hypothetical protein